MDNSKRNHLGMTRRKFLLLSSSVGILTIAAGLVSSKYLALGAFKANSDIHQKGDPDESDFDTSVLITVALFIGAYFGRDLLGEHRNELMWRLNYSVRVDSGWRSEYRWLAEYVNGLAKRRRGLNFATATPQIREEIIGEIMNDFSAWSRRSSLLAIVSDHERNRRRLHRSTLKHLRNLYRRSGVPWLFRGYSHWQGIPGDWSKYTEPGPVQKC